MSPQLRGTPLSSRAQQRGAIGLMAALTLGLVLLFMLLVVDSGRLYMEQRKLQRVADMAALEAVSRGGTCLGSTPTAASYANQSATRNAFTPSTTQTVNATCGTLVTGSDKLRTFSADINKAEAIRVITTTVVPTSLAGGVWNLYSGAGVGLNTKLTASAVGATAGAPLAMLTIRTTLGTIDSSKSAILNGLIGGLLGGTLNLDVASWKGLATTDINLLSYLNQLAISAGVDVGDYDKLLKADLTPTKLINAAITVLEKGGSTTTVAVNSLKKIALISSNTQLVKLGEILNIQSGTPSAGLDSTLKVYDLLQTFAQLSNGKSTATVDSTIAIPLIATIGVKLKVIEPPQLSVVGNPALAKKDPLGPNKIFVRTAQVRTDVNVSIPVLKTLSQITTALSNILSPITNLVNKLLHLNLFGVLSDVLCLAVYCDQTSLRIVSDIDIHLEAASAESYVSDYSCASNASKTLKVNASTSLAKLSIGKIPAGTPAPSINDNTKPTIDVDPIKLISIDTPKCSLLFGCLPLKPEQIEAGGSLSLKVQTSVGSRTGTILYKAPALRNINEATDFESLQPTTDILYSLGNTLSGVQITTFNPKTGNIASDALAGVAGLLSDISGFLVTAIQGILSPLLDPVLNSLLSALGVSLGNADIGANLSCNQGGRAQLVL